MTNSVDPDQLASSEAKWSGSTLFAKVVYIQVQQVKSKWKADVYYSRNFIMIINIWYMANVLKFQTLYSIPFLPKLCVLCSYFLKYLVERQTV